jgi:hypothetical protein
MTNSDFIKVINNQNFLDLATLALVKAAVQIKAESTTGNATKDAKRQAFADIILKGGVAQKAWLMALVVNIANPDDNLTCFTTSPTGAIPGTFDQALYDGVSGVWNALAGFSILA